MMMIEDFKKDINNSFREILENTDKHVEALKEETHTEEHNKPGKRFEQGNPRSKNGNKNIKEIIKGENPGVKKPRKEIRSHR
jgi:rubrerythrin